MFVIDVFGQGGADGGQKPVELGRGRFSHQLYSTIGQVLYVAGHSKPSGRSPRGVPKTDPLDPAAVVDDPPLLSFGFGHDKVRLG